MSFPYVLAERDTGDKWDPDGAVAVEQWRSKNINPILFPVASSGDRFLPLWQTLNAWAQWAREDVVWIDRELADKTSVDYDQATAFGRSFVSDLLSLLEEDEVERAISALQARGVGFGWN